MTGFFTAVFSRIDEYIKSFDDGIPRNYFFQTELAVKAAEDLVIKLSDFRERVSEGFPHRTDALALTDEVEKTLREQHGGLSPLVFMHKFANGEFGKLSSRGDIMATEMLCRRWLRSGIEFQDLHRTWNPWSPNIVFGETEISSTVAFMRKWLKNQKDGSHFVEVERD